MGMSVDPPGRDILGTHPCGPRGEERDAAASLRGIQERAEGEDGAACCEQTSGILGALRGMIMDMMLMQACCVEVASWLLRSDLEQVRI